jgi:hypothetical protein
VTVKTRYDRAINQRWPELETRGESVPGPIVRLGIEEAGNLYAVGAAGQDCSAWYVAYSSSGAVVGQTAAPQGVWFLNPDDSDQTGPGNTQAAACDKNHVISLAALDNSRALLLRRGAVVTTSDGGMSWKKVGNLSSTMAVAGAGSRYWAAGSAQACDGVVVRSLTVTGDH